MSAETDIFDFEGIFSAAFEQVYEAVDLTTLSIKGAPKFQQPRGRVNVHVAAAIDGDVLYPESNQKATAGNLRTLSGSGRCELEVITNAVPQPPDVEENQSLLLHTAFRCRIRNINGTMCRRVNFEILTRHRVQSFKEAQLPNYGYDQKNGIYATKMFYDFSFSIQASALAELDA